MIGALERAAEILDLGLGALGLVHNALVLFNTRNLDATIAQLRAESYEVRDADAARLSPFRRSHINLLGPLLVPAAH